MYKTAVYAHKMALAEQAGLRRSELNKIVELFNNGEHITEQGDIENSYSIIEL